MLRAPYALPKDIEKLACKTYISYFLCLITGKCMSSGGTQASHLIKKIPLHTVFAVQRSHDECSFSFQLPCWIPHMEFISGLFQIMFIVFLFLKNLFITPVECSYSLFEWHVLYSDLNSWQTIYSRSIANIISLRRY